MKADTEGAYTTSLQIRCLATREENTSPTTPLTPRNKTRTTETGKHPHRDFNRNLVENANSRPTAMVNSEF